MLAVLLITIEYIEIFGNNIGLMGSDRLLSEVGDCSMDLMGMYKRECNWGCDMFR